MQFFSFFDIYFVSYYLLLDLFVQSLMKHSKICTLSILYES